MSDQPQRSGDLRHAWRDLEAHDLPKRPIAERTHDFAEAHVGFDEEEAKKQASRCIQCPSPTCVTSCPLGSHIQEWMLLAAEGRFREASALVRDAGGLPEICARVCPHDHLCEDRCVLNGPSAPVSIAALEQFLAGFGPDLGEPETVPTLAHAPAKGRRVAVVGTGPAALAAADELRRRGFGVEIFGAEVPPSVRLGFGAAPFRLDPALVERRWEMLREGGAVFRSGSRPGESPTLELLRREFEAVFVGLDARRARPLGIPGSERPEVMAGEDFLVRTAGGTRAGGVAGKRVVVIGEDDLAVDCARSAVRAEATEVVVVVPGPEVGMSAGRREFEDAREEGVHFLFAAAPLSLDAGESGGNPRLRVSVGGGELVLETHWVIPCLGFEVSENALHGDLASLHGDGPEEVPVDGRQMTRVPGVFAGGDLVHGPCLVVQAVRDARLAAEGIELYLAAMAVPAPGGIPA